MLQSRTMTSNSPLSQWSSAIWPSPASVTSMLKMLLANTFLTMRRTVAESSTTSALLGTVTRQ